jgi:hypothetical protein
MCYRFLIVIAIFLSDCTHPIDMVIKEKESLGEQFEEGWMNLSQDLWSSPEIKFDFDPAKFPPGDQEKEKIKPVKAKDNLELFAIDSDYAPNEHTYWINIGNSCSGSVETDYIINYQTWNNPEARIKYYRKVEQLIERVSAKIFEDFKLDFAPEEKREFAKALKTLAWQESAWMHYYVFDQRLLLYIGLSGFNSLGDWGITQVAKSAHKKSQLLNTPYFNSKAYCSIFSSLYYGFTEYLYAYIHARKSQCNLGSGIDRIIGAYNRYVSGFSSCHDRFSKTNREFRDFQTAALNNFRNTFTGEPWLQTTGQLSQ